MHDFRVHECPNCGGIVSAFARSCAFCGAPNRARRGRLALAAALGAVALAAVVAAIAALSGPWNRAADDQTQEGDEFAWLSTAMKGCDDDAAKNPDTLYFIVIPLAADSNDVVPWRPKSLNDIGNGILLTSTNALEALNEKTLKISAEQYVFGIRDQAAAVYKWKPSAGVARFSTPDAESITSFNIQFMAGANAREAAWGAGFRRQKGTCYWVNAIIGF